MTRSSMIFRCKIWVATLPLVTKCSLRANKADNGYMSHNGPNDPDILRALMDVPYQYVFSINHKLPVFKSYRQAISKIGGWQVADRADRKPQIIEANSIDEMIDIMDDFYGRKRRRK